MSETELVKTIQLEHGRGDVRLFRNNVGEGWQGVVSKAPRGPWAANSLIIQNPRRVNFGLAVGSSDLIGLQSEIIVPEMVGERVAIFVSIEVKTGRGAFRKGQPEWLTMVREFGGIAGVARDVQEATNILNGAGLWPLK